MIPRNMICPVLTILLMLPAGILKALPPDEFTPGDRDKKILRPGGWEIPDLATAVRQGRKFEDRTRQIPGEETRAVGYVGRTVPLFVVWMIDDNAFEIIVDEDGRAPFDYSLWDMDGDGKFEIKAHPYLDEEPPQWAIDRYFRKRGLQPPSKPGGEPEGGTAEDPDRSIDGNPSP